jgi:glycosyltransferase involved in cell wall biosynthesis
MSLKIGITTNEFVAHGGVTMVVANMVEALQHDHEVTVYTFKSSPIEAINEVFGGQLQPDRVRVELLPCCQGLQRHVKPLRSYMLSRFCKRCPAPPDVWISGDNEMDFGCSGIQYIHFPVACAKTKVLRYLNMSQPRAAISALKRTLLAPIFQFRAEAMTRNITLTNSHWTAERIREAYGIRAAVLYPPISDSRDELSEWHTRENGFVCVGRMSPDKNLELVIRIVSRLRRRGHDVHLHIVGLSDAPGYVRYLRRRYQTEMAWLFIQPNVTRAELRTLLGTHRFGIHGKRNEHFGIVVGEMLESGVIPFIPDSGGQVEILRNVESLWYTSEDDAVDRIEAVLRGQGISRVQGLLSKLRGQFSPARFQNQFRGIVQSFANAGHDANGVALPGPVKVTLPAGYFGGM